MAFHDVMYVVVLPRPLITVGLQDTEVRRNTSVQLECQFKAATIERFTYVTNSVKRGLVAFSNSQLW